MRHGTLNLAGRNLLYSIILHGVAFGAIAFTFAVPSEKPPIQKTEPVIATLWSAPLPVPPVKAAQSEPVEKAIAPPAAAVEMKAAPAAPASPTLPDSSPADVPERPVEAEPLRPSAVWESTSPLASSMEPPKAQPAEPQATQDMPSAPTGFDEAMRRASEKVEASGTSPLKSTDLGAVEGQPPVSSDHTDPVANVAHEPLPELQTDDEVLSSSFDPLSLYQQKVAALIQKSLRLDRTPSGSRCVMGIQIMNNGLIVESYQLAGDPGLCDDAIKATARVGALPPPPKELGEERFHNLRVGILF